MTFADSVNNICEKYPFVAFGVASAIAVGISSGLGYIYGKAARVPAVSCAKILAISHMAQIILTYLSNKNSEDRLGVLVNYVLINGFISGITLGILLDKKLIGPIGALAFCVYTIARVAFCAIGSLG
jgi:uncharacterized membrane protein YoaK (UPF0700 family)